MIEIKGLDYRYPGASDAALSNIDFQLKDRSLHGLLGPNGAGKTTLLSLLSGLLPCPPASIWINGQDLANTAPAEFAGVVALVPQEYAFYPKLSVHENLRFFAGVQGLGKALLARRVDRVVELTDLGKYYTQRAERLSGGLKRRLNIAIGLLSEPKLLLLDEPTVGIDPHSRHFILEAIKQINAAGSTVVYTSHYMEEVEYLCDEITIIDHGQVILSGKLGELLAAQHHETLQVDFLEPLSAVQQELLGGFGIVVEGRRLQCVIENGERINLILAELGEQQLPIARIQYGARNLEELFLNQTQRALRD